MTGIDLDDFDKIQRKSARPIKNKANTTDLRRVMAYFGEVLFHRGTHRQLREDTITLNVASAIKFLVHFKLLAVVHKTGRHYYCLPMNVAEVKKKLGVE